MNGMINGCRAVGGMGNGRGNKHSDSGINTATNVITAITISTPRPPLRLSSLVFVVMVVIGIQVIVVMVAEGHQSVEHFPQPSITIRCSFCTDAGCNSETSRGRTMILSKEVQGSLLEILRACKRHLLQRALVICA